MLFSEPKIPQYRSGWRIRVRAEVSVLFSEPKIPQWCEPDAPRADSPCFSALQRAENSSIGSGEKGSNRCVGFSALQRAENSSMYVYGMPQARVHRVSVLFSEPKIPQSSAGRSGRYWTGKFQCSSASRKFLNSSSTRRGIITHSVSVLFSEPKIPQLTN